MTPFSKEKTALARTNPNEPINANPNNRGTGTAGGNTGEAPNTPNAPKNGLALPMTRDMGMTKATGEVSL